VDIIGAHLPEPPHLVVVVSLHHAKTEATTAYSLGVLANVDSSILKLALEHGLTIEAVPVRQGEAFISDLENRPVNEVHEMLDPRFPCVNEGRMYFVRASFADVVQTNSEGVVTGVNMDVISGFDTRDYLLNVLQLLRLFKEGNVRMPLKYDYLLHNGKPMLFSPLLRSASDVAPDTYSISDSEISEVQALIQSTKLPFRQAYLQLALENFELSYNVPNLKLAFLSLMISLETMLNPGGGEITHRLARNTCVLLGKDSDNSRAIYDDVKRLYRKRSNLIHSGDEDIELEDVSRLRKYVRQSIREIDNTGLSKNELVDMLDSCGFGDRRWRQHSGRLC